MNPQVLKRNADNILRRYAESLCPHLAEASVVPRVTLSHESWRPAVHECHANVAQWVELNPAHKAVMGWSVLDRRIGAGACESPYVQLFAHSVVESEDGVLKDVTPVMAAPDGTQDEVRFLRHVGTKEEYVALLEQYRLGSIVLWGHEKLEDVTFIAAGSPPNE